jgi:uncharacterized SAM-binding protein YcdF (DUF218 family)
MKEIVFVFKQAVSVLLYPIGTCLLCLFAGLLVLKRRRNSRFGIWLVAFAAAWLFITSLPLTSYLLVHPLEEMAGPSANPTHLSKLGVRYVLVLGGGGASDRRIVEGVRLSRHIPDSLLILSGGRKPEGTNMRDLPLELGVPPSSMDLEAGAFDTGDEASIFWSTLGQEPFALVTSAYHMPRALRTFRTMGLNPIAAPCEFRAADCPSLVTCLMPNADALLTTQLAIHEYAGMLWLGIRGALGRISR